MTINLIDLYNSKTEKLQRKKNQFFRMKSLIIDLKKNLKHIHCQQQYFANY